jgi:hypothetical protein
MKRINLANRKTNRNNETRNSVTWGQACRNNAGPLVFAALLIACSFTVGCSSDKPQPASSNHPAPVTQPVNTMASNTAAPLTAPKPAAKKVVKKRATTVTYTDKASGLSFVYPRKYALETGDAASALLIASPVPMNFVQPGGVAIAAVELPDSIYADTDLSSAFFNVSVHKTLTADQCQEFSVPQNQCGTDTTLSQTPAACNPSGQAQPADAKLLLGDLELHSTEAVSGEGARQADSKYFHVFNPQNGSCYEFALNLTTNTQATDGTLKHVDRDKVFARLETILSTVKLDPVKLDPVKTDAEKADTNVEPTKVDAGKMDGDKVDAMKADAANTESADSAAVKPDAEKVEAVTPDASKPVASTTPANPASETPVR